MMQKYTQNVYLQDIATSGIDLAIYIDAPREKILQRNLGRLFDPVTAEP